MARSYLVRLTASLGITVVMLWIADGLVALVPSADARRIATARDAGVTIDPRTALAFVRDLRKSGKEAYPSAYVGNHWKAFPFFRDSLIPLGGISNVLSVMCSEGPYVTFLADERGLTNPPGQWSLLSPEFALVGDSYVMGFCVPPEASFAARIRARHPSTIVAGFGASGPLTQLGQMREFLAAVRPRTVLWFYHEGNDLADLGAERTHPILSRYLDAGFSQGLARRQPEVDARLKELVEARERRTARPPVRAVTAVLSLTHLRQLVGAITSARRACCDLPLYRRVIVAAKSVIEGWGGSLTVVYLPSEARISGRPLNAGERSSDSVVAILHDAGIPVLDLREALRSMGTPRELIPFPGAHYSARGNEAVASLVLRHLESRGAAPAGR